jgi:hypothetical protein
MLPKTHENAHVWAQSAAASDDVTVSFATGGRFHICDAILAQQLCLDEPLPRLVSVHRTTCCEVPAQAP